MLSSSSSSQAQPSNQQPPRALTFYVFDRAGTCLHYADFGRTRGVGEGAGTPGDEARLVFGLLFSLRTLTAALDPTAADKKQLGAPLRIGEGATFHSLSTDAYTLHCLESPTGLKFVLTTTTTAATENEGGGGSSGGTIGAGATTTSQQQDIDVRDVLARIYAYAYVDGAARSPAFRRGEPFNFRLFSERLRACLGPMVST